ncbi:YebC/PmpR family DNA-binding transcriptional regulator [Candidatus Microgenomates bacterium]|nr:YebC/PmpR family DNA-binding transcriptional regulator [Candidatus Microgenomates bacterium]
MSGHSKWHNIQVRKGKQDAKRAGAFTALSRAITAAAREGGGDINMNFKLRIAVERAKAVSMPKDNIQKAIDRGTGAGSGVALVAISYEAKGPGGMDIIVDCLTDNKNRTASEIKHIFTKNGGTVGAPGSVGWNFEQKGVVVINPKSKNQMPSQAQSSNDQTILKIMDIEGVADVEEDEDGIEIYTAPKELAMVSRALEEKDFKIEKAELVMSPKNTVKLEGEKAEQALKLLEALDDYDDTENVWTNLG